MASIRREVAVQAEADRVWERLRDVAAAADLFPGVLVDSRLEGDCRIVTFADGTVLRERIVDVDDTERRVVYAVLGDPFLHHSASMQIQRATATTSRFIWISDFLPDGLRAGIEPLVDAGVAAFVKRWAD